MGGANSNMQGSKGQHGKGQDAPKVPIPPKVGSSVISAINPGGQQPSGPATGMPTPGPIPQNYGGSKRGMPPSVQQPPTSNAGNVPPGAVSAYLSAARGRMF